MQLIEEKEVEDDEEIHSLVVDNLGTPTNDGTSQATSY
jgi:hypothetical protein